MVAQISFRADAAYYLKYLLAFWIFADTPGYAGMIGSRFLSRGRGSSRWSRAAQVHRGIVKAVRLHKVGGPESLVYEDAPQPDPKDGEVLIRVHAVAVTPTEFAWAPTWKTRTGEARPFPIIMGHEFSGRVAAVGSGVTDVEIDDTVYGLNDWFADGAEAEYCITRTAYLAPKPRSVDHVQAAGVPISGLTAWQALFDHGRLRTGQRVLIHGAAGGVGGFAVQLARWRGAHVIGTALERDAEFVKSLGADEVIDYTTTRFEQVVHDADLVLDTVGGETLERSWSVLKPDGKMVTVSHLSQNAENQAAREAFFIMEPNRAQLVDLARLIDTGLICPVIAAVFPLQQAQHAYEQGRRGASRGKIVLRVV